MEKVILTTGGTGGHIFPALAAAEELRARRPGIELLFIGSLYGPEKELAAKWGLPFAGLNVRGFLGRGPKALAAAVKMLKALGEAKSIIKRFNPDLVAGFGGYASFAPVAAAWLSRKPVLLHEQNAVAGAGNMLLSRLADKVCVSIPGTSGMGKEAFVTGNPTRKIFKAVYERRKGKAGGKNLLIIGGSQGARALTKFICANLGRLAGGGISVRLQTGSRDLEGAREAFAKHGLDPGRAQAFIDNMAEAYEWADLALCRAGASTIAELCVCGVPSVLTPFPAAIHDHQTKNAKALADAGACLLIPEAELDSAEAISQIAALISNEGKLTEMGAAARSLARENAAALLADRMEEMLKK